MKRILCAGAMLLLLLSSATVKGQAFQFSQFYNAPVILNPALTGKVDGAARVSLNYRNQWFNPAEKPYITYAGSFDAPIILRNDDAIGLGLYISNDQTGNDFFNHTAIMASFAYHKALGRMAKHSISFGGQVGLLQRRLDINKGLFFDQFNPGTGLFDGSIPTQDNLVNDAAANFNLNIGLVMNHLIGKKINLYYGFSMSNVMEPKESFLDGSEFAVPRKYLGHLGLEYKINKWFRLLPSVIYVRQLNADQFNVGLSGAVWLTGGASIYVGGYFRVTESFGQADDLIFYSAFEFKGVRLGFSYDGSLTSLKNTPQPTGAFEMSLMYTVKGKGLPNVNSLLFCPRF